MAGKSDASPVLIRARYLPTPKARRVSPIFSASYPYWLESVREHVYVME